MSKITYKRVNLPANTFVAYQDKVARYVSQVEEAKVEESGADVIYYRITYKNLTQPSFIKVTPSDVRFIHTCEATTGGSSCAHFVIAGVIANKLLGSGKPITLLGAPSAPTDFNIPQSAYTDISDKVEVIPSVPAPTPLVATTSASVATAAAAHTTSSVPKRDWRVDWADVKEYLENTGISHRMILQLQQIREAVFTKVALTDMAVAPKKPKTPYIGETLGRALRHLLMGKDLLLVGDKGAGKDTLVSTLAWIFGYPIYLQTGNGNETKASIVGENTLIQGDKGTEVVFKKSAFATCIEHGGLVHYAELNMLDGDVTSLFHSVLDENRQLASSDIGSIERHEHSLFIGSINIGDHYAGTKSLNSAFKDRLAVIHLPYVQDFRAMLISKTGLTDSYALDFLEACKKAIDELITIENQGEESRTIRGYIDSSTYLKDYGVTFDTKVEALEDFVINKTENFEERMAIRDMIRQKAWSDFPISAEEEVYINGK
ncbi:AAA family ATPase [Brevibacillus sp. 179-C8.2 HS]